MLLDVKLRLLKRKVEFWDGDQWTGREETVLQMQKTFMWNHVEWEETTEWTDVPTEQE